MDDFVLCEKEWHQDTRVRVAFIVVILLIIMWYFNMFTKEGFCGNLDQLCKCSGWETMTTGPVRPDADALSFVAAGH